MPPAASEGGNARDAVQQQLLLGCFFLSGLAALVYQTAWMRQFSLVFGTSELAVATVLASYMAGLAAGAAVAARLAPRMRRPVRVYGLLELGIALAALAVPAALRGAQQLQVALLGVDGALPSSGGAAGALFYLGSAFLILLIPTALMGATLPLLARHAVRSEREIGAKIGVLYATNTVGAVAGTLLAGFVLLPGIGLQRTVWVAVGANAAVFALAIALARRSSPLAPAEPRAEASRGEPRRAWILAFVLLSGAVSFAYEVLWTRLLGHLLGGSVYAFATMLATFLSGIAIGSWLASRRAADARAGAQGFAFAQLGAGLFSLLAYQLLDHGPALAQSIGTTGSMRLLAETSVAALVLLPGTICIGATFPFAVRVLATSERDAAPASARVYAWNTLGAIAGAIGAGFFLIPAIGFAAVLSAAVACNLALAAAAALLLPWRQPRVALATLVGVALLLVLRPEPPWRLLQTSHFDLTSSRRPVLFYSVGRSATVLLQEDLGAWRLSTNGLPEAAILPPGGRGGEFRVAQWLGSLYALARPEARRVLVIGLGGGTALEWVPASAEQIDVVEIEPEVVRANESIGARRRHDPLAEPRVRVVVNDARAALALGGVEYDAIVSQPSHPWTAGASHLYTRDFFDLVRDSLTPDGVFVQWMGLHFVDAALFRSLLATLQEAFPYVRVYNPKRGAAVFIASQSPLDVERRAERAIASDPEHFAKLGVHGPADLAAALLLDEEGVRGFARGAAVSTDDRNLLQMRSPAIARSGAGPLDIRSLLVDYDPLARPDLEWDRAYLVRRAISYGMPARARRIALAEADPAARAAALAVLLAALQKPQEAQAQVGRAVLLGSDSADARLTLLKLRHLAGLEPRPRDQALAQQLRDPEAAVFAGWNAQKRADWDTLRALDARLALAEPPDPGFADAIRLRARWRLREGSPERNAEALALLDSMLPFAGNLDDLLMRAQVAALTGHERGALTTLSELAMRLPRDGSSPLALRALAILRIVPASEETRSARRRLQQMLLRRGGAARLGGGAEGAESQTARNMAGDGA